MPNSDLDILAVDAQLGSDGDLPGLSQPITMDEINDVIYAASDSVAERVEKLQMIRQDLVARNTADFVDSYDDYISAIDAGLAELQGEADGFITPESLDEFDDPEGLPTETSAVDDPDPARPRTASGSVSSRFDPDTAHTPDGAPTTNPASYID